jgi:glycosyltransferase involved in cell wall biosynthesis
VSKQLNICHVVESYPPSIGGMPEVVRQLSERLVERGHKVTVVTSFHPNRNAVELNGVSIRSFKISGNSVEGLKGEVNAYEDFLLKESEEFDVLTFFAAQQWGTDIALPLLSRLKVKKVSVPTGYSQLFNPSYKEYFNRMSHFIHDYDMNVFLSSNYRDIHFAKTYGVQNCMIIPNGAAFDEFDVAAKEDVRSLLGIKSNELLILHVGSYTGVKGHKEAVEIFLQSSLRRSTLLFIGNGVKKFRPPYRQVLKFSWLKLAAVLSGKRIVMLEMDRKHTVAAYQQSDVFLFPSNIECSPIVLFECAAAGLPFLSSCAGNSTEIAFWTGGGEIMPSSQKENGFTEINVKESAQVLSEFCRDTKKLSNMAERARQIWKTNYTWEKIAEQYETLYSTLKAKS